MKLKMYMLVAISMYIIPSVYAADCNGWSISKDLISFIHKTIPAGKTILELGSGCGTGELAKSYTMYSIEHDEKWLHKHNSTYIYAPIENGWYSISTLQSELPKSYDLILVDGPTGAIGRYGFFQNIHLFNTNVPIIFDDVNRGAEKKLMEDVSAFLKRPYSVHKSQKKAFGIILPN